MKTTAILFVLICLATAIAGQDKYSGPGEAEPRFLAEKSSEQASDFLSISDYLQHNVVYPEQAKKQWVEGVEIVRFTVTPQGKVTNFKFVNSLHPEIDKEVARVLKKTDGMWEPGTLNNQPVKMEREVCVSFILEERDPESAKVYLTQRALQHLRAGNEHLLKHKNAKRALRKFNECMKYCPKNCCLLLMRGLARYELGDIEGAHEDWDRMLALGGIELNRETMQRQFSEFKGFSALTEKLKSQEFSHK
ncbi:energy transducer TonB [Marinilabilia sp.]